MSKLKVGDEVVYRPTGQRGIIQDIGSDDFKGYAHVLINDVVKLDQLEKMDELWVNF